MKRVVVVTGGSRGIGKAIVERFQAAGDFVATCATTVETAAESGADASFACDVSDAEQVRAFVADVIKSAGRIDVVINNAGVSGGMSLDPDSDDELWHRIFDVNLHGTYYISKHALPHLPDGTGRIVNIASILALRGVPDQPAYTAAKHAVVGLTRSLAHFVGPRGITVNAVCPGWVETEMASRRWGELEMTRADAGAAAPIGRVVQPSEVAELCFYLASDAAGAVTGQAIPIDGGSSA
jgi:NAD(P)-dependent dehydrogenase (short-subunit alcohol dehydrogenase family)